MDTSAIYFVAAIASSFIAATRSWGDCRNLTAPHLHRVVLVLLLVVLEIDAHKVALESLGLLANNYPVPPALFGP